ncbi:MAG: spermidine synthase [Oligoflexus sp.]
MPRRIYLMCFVFAACSMLYYLLFSKVLAEMTGDMSIWGSICAATYLCMLGLGLLWAEKLDLSQVYRKIASLELIIAISAPVAFIVLYFWHIIYRIYIFDYGHLSAEAWPRAWYFGVIAQLPLAWIGFLSGLEAAFLNRLSMQNGLFQLQRLIATYYFGGLLGSLALILLLAPRFEPLHIVLLASTINLLVVAYWLWSFLPDQRRQSSIHFTITSASMIGCAVVIFFGQLIETQRKNFYYNHYTWSMDSAGIVSFQFPKGPIDWWREARQYPEIERHLGPYQVIDFVATPEAANENWTMMMNGRFQVSSSLEKAYHETFAHVPSMIQNRLGKHILILGGGDGFLAREILKFDDEIETLTLVDIDAKILHLARQHKHLKSANQHSMQHPKLELQQMDAFIYMRRQNRKFDRVYLDGLYPYNHESARLYTVEFLGSVLNALQPDGLLVMLSPIDIEGNYQPAKDPMQAAIMSTLDKAGCQSLALFAEERHSFMLCSKRQATLVMPANYQQNVYFRRGFSEDSLMMFKPLSSFFQASYVNSVVKPTFNGLPDSFF